MLNGQLSLIVEPLFAAYLPREKFLMDRPCVLRREKRASNGATDPATIPFLPTPPPSHKIPPRFRWKDVVFLSLLVSFRQASQTRDTLSSLRASLISRRIDLR